MQSSRHALVIEWCAVSSIELQGVAKHWGKAAALREVDLRIAARSFCVLLGPSGCGKSTTLRIIAGLDAASAGRVLIDGIDVSDLPPAQRGIAMVFQNYALFPHLNVAQNIGFGLSVRGLPADVHQARLAQVAELLDLTPLLKRKPSQLSGGQQQRVALGRALVAQAKVCLMDEPLSNLDAQLRQEMRHELRELQRKLGLTVVYVTHDQTEAMSMADQVVLLNKGKVEQVGSARDLYARPATTFAAGFIGTPPMNLIQLEGGRIAHSDVDIGLQAPQLGLRPENIQLASSGVAATLQGTEYLGADMVLRCAIGTQTLLVRANGQTDLAPGQAVWLRWSPADAHAFDCEGRRI
jgi:sn-glycerol 3-phosphate transport system ATP-binding protein